MEITDSFRVSTPLARHMEGPARHRGDRPVPAGRAAAGDRGQRVPRRREGEGRSDHRAVQGNGHAGRGRRVAAPHRDRRRRARHARAGQRERVDRRDDERRRRRDGRRGRDRPVDHRQGRAVRARRARRRVGEAAAPVRREPRTRRVVAPRAASTSAVAERRRRCRRVRCRRRVRRRAGTELLRPRPDRDRSSRATSSRSTSSTWPAQSAAKRVVPLVIGAAGPVRPLAPAPEAAPVEPPRSGPAHHPRIEPMFDPRGPVLGIDPGLSRCGYGIVMRDGGDIRALGCGVIRTPADEPLPERLVALDDELARARRADAAVGDGGRARAVPDQRPHRHVGRAGERPRPGRGHAGRRAGRAVQPQRGEARGHRRRPGRQGGGADDGRPAARTCATSRSRPTPPTRSRSRAAISGACRSTAMGVVVIGSLRGTIVERTMSGEVLVEVGGVGYRALVPSARRAVARSGCERVPVHAPPRARRRDDALRLPDPRRARHVRGAHRRDGCRAEARARDPLGAHAGGAAPLAGRRRSRCARRSCPASASGPRSG